MTVTTKLRIACGHDSRRVEGCTNCEAADLIDALYREVQGLKNALWKACGDDEETVNAYIESERAT